MNQPELDAFACDLAGVNQIEASAGTGKTWNICALYARLVIENDLEVDEILVVTFTNAATAELQERIRGRLTQLERVLDPACAGRQDNDPFVLRLLDAMAERELDQALAYLRVRRALGRFDQAAIHTIHAFCQRALQEAPFAAGLPFAFELDTDDRALRLDLAAAFWREQVEAEAAAHADFAAWLVEHGASPAALDERLARSRRKPLAELRWNGLTPDAGAAEAAQACAREAVALWQLHEASLVELLADTEAVLNQKSHTAERIADAFAAWRGYSERGAFGEAMPAAALKLSQAALNKAAKKNQGAPAHAFFTALDTLSAAQQAAAAALEAHWLMLIARWLDYAPAALAERKRARRTVSYDDLLSNLYRALREHPWLAEILRARYPAALIDEFQDTDPLQFEVFSQVFAPHGPLFLVGDPKQAIYSFRAADLHTYLSARAHASACYSLAVNQRSTPAVVEACNRIFGANPQAFVLDGLEYHAVRAAPRERAPLIDPQGPNSDAGLHVWRLPDNPEPLGKRVSQQRAAQACAAEIARLLRGAREGSVRIGDAPLAPGEIAVLVQTHRQGSQVKRALAAWGIGSVELAQASVFASLDAEQLERVLAAIDTPGDLRRLRTALAADWFGLDAVTLLRLAAEVSETDAALGMHRHPEGMASESASDWVERFARYRQLWHERGFAVMWRTFDRELGVARRLIASEDGERRATDLNHLAELVQARASSQPGIARTLRWVAAQRREGGGEAAQLRLESDRDLVQIVTVHRSKGLEYAVVFCPYLYDGKMRTQTSAKLPDAFEYRADDGRAVLHYGCSDEQAELARRAMEREQAAERARLIYVALTRAVHRCYLVAGVYSVGKSSTKEAARGMLNWIAAGQGSEFDQWCEKPPAPGAIDAAWQALDGGPISLAPLPEPRSPRPLTAQHALGAWRAAREMRRTRLPAWRIASFSSLAAARARAEAGTAAPEETRPDHDAWTVPLPIMIGSPEQSGSAPDPDDIVLFPRGAAAGECLHRLFELADFSDASSWPEAARRALVERPVAADAELAARLPAMMTRLANDICSTELVPGLRLSALDPARRLIELEFLFPAAGLDFEALRALLDAHGYPGIAFESGRLEGYIKGFIDLIFEHEGRFWIIDWKSNHLGATPEAYGPRALAVAMDEHAYELQALLYTVALHRFLRSRVPGYDYDTHIAGYLYLFVRGVRPDWTSAGQPAGVHARRAPRALIEALDAMLRGETV